MRLQDADDLRFGIALALHLWTSLGSTDKEIPHRAWLELQGYGQGCYIISKVDPFGLRHQG